jgi:hypothetical protein
VSGVAAGAIASVRCRSSRSAQALSLERQFLENPFRAPDASCIQQMPRIEFSTARDVG